MPAIVGMPSRLGGDHWTETWQIPCPGCATPLEFVLGLHPLVANAWLGSDGESFGTDVCDHCGEVLADERDVADELRALRAAA